MHGRSGSLSIATTAKMSYPTMSWKINGFVESNFTNSASNPSFVCVLCVLYLKE